MVNNEKEQKFSYTYSAKEQAEIKRIREKYAPETKEENKLEKLIKLDASVTSTAQVVALILGIIGALIFGFGLSLFLSDFGKTLGLTDTANIVFGIILGIFGGVTLSFAYPAYLKIVNIKRKKITPEILKLTDELMK